MTGRRTFGRWVALALAMVLIALPLTPALADDGGAPPVPTIVSGVYVNNVDLSGMTADEAVTAILAGVQMPTFAPLYVKAGTKTFDLDPISALRIDATATAQVALAATSTVLLTPLCTVDAATVSRFVASVAKGANCSAVNAKRKVVKRHLKTYKSKNGLNVTVSTTAASVTSALLAEAAAGGAARPTVVASGTVLKPKIPDSKLGKAILIVLGRRKLYLYSGAKVQRTYRCAVGMAAHPTPRGVWKVVRKVKNPSWYNNGSAWASHMPSFIGPGRNNPLGTRALYLNASGIRIHGIPASENSSIGHAASHGCIRLKNSNAVKLYPLVKVGTVVYIIK